MWADSMKIFAFLKYAYVDVSMTTMLYQTFVRSSKTDAFLYLLHFFTKYELVHFFWLQSNILYIWEIPAGRVLDLATMTRHSRDQLQGWF